jgi:glycolate oxidase iron-sulfur subunit
MDVLREAATSAWDPHQPPDPELIKDCVHCGFCLPTCPSYSVFEEEMDSPRGRIVLMNIGHEPGERVSPQMRVHFDRCLGCMACVTACPSGVQYDRLIEQVRPQLERNAPRRRSDRLFHRLVFALFTHPGRLRALVPVLAVQSRLRLGRLARFVPFGRLRALASLAPDVRLGATVRRLPVITPAAGTVRRGRVALMQGCINRVLFGDVNEATVRVLAAEGWEVHAPRQPRCCGALQLHSGVEPAALELARQTIAAYEQDHLGGDDSYDAILVNVAGCGSAMKDYGRLLAGDPLWAQRAAAFSAKVRDVHEFLAEQEPQATRHRIDLTVAYHDACHLAHAQGIRQPPRDLLRSIPGVVLVEPAEWELCCGSAGIYNLTQPEAAATLGRRKAANLAATGASAIAAANPGCALQIVAHSTSRTVRVFHPMTLLDHAIRGVQP